MVLMCETNPHKFLMSSHNILLLPQRLFYINYHRAQCETRLVTSHIWLESIGYGKKLVAKGVLQKFIIPQGVVLES